MTRATALGERALHVVGPDLSPPTGGNRYDRQLMDALVARGWQVQCTEIPGSWPAADPAMLARLHGALDAVPDAGRVLVDGIVGCSTPAVLEAAAERLHLAVVVHLPLPDETGLPPARASELAQLEARALQAAETVFVTSPWAARRLGAYGLPPGGVVIARPGTEPATLAGGSRDADAPPALVCVASVAPRKDQLTLVRALAAIRHLPWTCTLVGPTDVAPAYVDAVRAEIADHSLTGRVRLVGARAGAELVETYVAADLVLLVSRAETYGMVVGEALSHGIPVVVSAGGAAEETLGRAPDGTVPGLVVPAGDAEALASALRRWLTGPELRLHLAAAARARRASLPSWADTAGIVAAALLNRQGSTHGAGSAEGAGSADGAGSAHGAGGRG